MQSKYSTPAVYKNYHRSPIPKTSLMSPPAFFPASKVTKSLELPTHPADLSVVVYGFPMRRQSEVLQKFYKMGTIQEEKPSGNWVTLTYSNRFEVNKALSLNGQMILDNTIIGVRQAKAVEQSPSFLPQRSAVIFRNHKPRRNYPFWKNLALYLFNLD